MSGSNASDLHGKSPDRRKLIAVVYADMVGYSRLIGLDDAGTLERLRTLRRNLIDPAIKQHDGRIVQTGGDSLLIVFDSIDGAVRCALRVQQQVPIIDGDQQPDRAIRFRVGVNIGDAIADGTDLHGDAVNVAARLQAECPPGCICVTRSVRDHVHGRLDLVFEELGTLNLKNIARPVEAFLIRRNTPTVPKSVERSLVHGTGEALPLPDKPSIAVLPFANLSADPEQEYFSDGVADDIITELSRSRSLFVIARNSSFTYRGRSVDVRQVARELGVRYVLEGSVRRNGAQVRVVAQLIEAETGNHIWAERYDRALEHLFAVQDEITEAVTHAIVPAISHAERQRAIRKAPENLNAWEAHQRGLWHMGKHVPADLERAQHLFRRASELDPLFAAPHAMLALTYMHIYVGAVVRIDHEMAEAESKESDRTRSRGRQRALGDGVDAQLRCPLRGCLATGRPCNLDQSERLRCPSGQGTCSCAWRPPGRGRGTAADRAAAQPTRSAQGVRAQYTSCCPLRERQLRRGRQGGAERRPRLSRLP